MYLDDFDLKEAPFAITPDPRFVHLTDQHRDALAHLLFGMTQGGSGGFVQLTGEVGTGKTTLCRLLMAQAPEHVRIALILNPMLQPVELLRSICDELRILLPKRQSSIKALTDALTAYLLESYAGGLRVILIIDEAQNLSFEAFEQVRMLTNLETPTQKLLQVILLGQPELRDRLARPELRQLAQRITSRYHLAPLDELETARYVEHRLAVAGRKKALFARDALRELFRQTQGYPRAINVVADRALLGAYARSMESIDARLVRESAAEVAGNPVRRRFDLGWRIPGLVMLGLIGIGLVAWRLGWVSPEVSNPPDAPELAQTTTAAALPAPRAFDSPKHAATSIIVGWQTQARRQYAKCGDVVPGEALCAALRINRTMLQRLDRPLLLALRHPDRTEWLALLHTEGEQATVVDRESTVVRPWASIAEHWLGDVILITSAPNGYDGSILAEGSTGPYVLWLHAVLARFDGVTEARSETFHAGTAERVRRLQTYFGLPGDGLVGPETMALVMALSDRGPRLAAELTERTFVSASQP